MTRRIFRKGSAALRTLKILEAYPVLTAPRLGTLLSITPPAANTAIKQLCQAGVPREQTGYARNRIYASDEVLGILNRPFSEESIVPKGAVESPSLARPFRLPIAPFRQQRICQNNDATHDGGDGDQAGAKSTKSSITPMTPHNLTPHNGAYATSPICCAEVRRRARYLHGRCYASSYSGVCSGVECCL